ncbi:Uncharacterised protein [Mycobacteroides abscessus subsp. abscessus]|nr:Uncharacterised protein [Mycobacteroides abscessus subsp. abscessus]
MPLFDVLENTFSQQILSISNSRLSCIYILKTVNKPCHELASDKAQQMFFEMPRSIDKFQSRLWVLQLKCQF